MALEPRDVVAEVERRAASPATTPAPPLLTRSVGTAERSAPLRQDADVAAMHGTWARVHDRAAAPPGGEPGKRGGLRSRAAAVAGAAVGPALAEDRELIGNVIRAADALVRRNDELADRLADLEALVEEVVQVVSEDLVRLRAVVERLAGAAAGQAGNAGPAGPGDPAGDG